MSKKSLVVKAYVQLLRPANMLTAITDVLAGSSLSGILLTSPAVHALPDILLLCLSTLGLYGGGIVFNDVCDADIDQVERPERPLPSGLIGKIQAMRLGAILFLIGTVMAFLVNWTTGCLAFVIIVAALAYNKWSKHHIILGPLNMGLCRGLNLMLGIAILSEKAFSYWYLAIVPILYIGAITLISRGEVHGSGKKPLIVAALLYALVIIAIWLFARINQQGLYTAVALLLFAGMVYLPLCQAIKVASGRNIGRAVKAGIISLIMMNAAWATATGNFGLAGFILLMMPLSIGMAHFFAVT